MSSKIQTKLESNMKELMGIQPPTEIIEVAENVETLPAVSVEKTDTDVDYEFARANIRSMIEAQQRSIETLQILADESEKARDFEVLAQFSSQILEANHGLIDLQIKYQKLKEMQGSKDDKGPEHVTNVAFVGTAADLQAMINSRQKKEE